MLKYLLFIVFIITISCKSDCQNCGSDASFTTDNTNTNIDGGIDAGTNSGKESENTGVATLTTRI